MHGFLRFLTNGCGGACDAAGACREKIPPSPVEVVESEEPGYEPVNDDDCETADIPEWNDLIVPRFDTATSSPSYHGRSDRASCMESFDGSTRAESSRGCSEGTGDKQKLRQLVRDFTAKAASGVACWQVDLRSGRVHKAMYQIDNELRRLILATDEDVRQCPPLSCDIADIVEFMRAEESLTLLEYPSVQDSLTPEEINRMIFLQVYHHDLEDVEVVAFLETSRNDREVFLAGMNILQIYTQAAAFGRSTEG
ncbi:hypothetical protein FOL47_003373 [Perkinsus chesapeaki]|uniref:Uncharacterized protein n=1 Tax=Perkinsus chesapeaki TaxID=330153 RepID=A0A7J6M8E1_PERCH|nr:hypothetical protein FOL47_003373 [Perkinsus chesapeaki]